MSYSEQAVQVMTTVGQREQAEQMAREVIDQRLAACAQVEGPLTSIYRWQGDVQREQEWRITFKTLARCAAAVEAAVQRSHPYEVPEVLVVPVTYASPDYARWLAEQVVDLD